MSSIPLPALDVRPPAAPPDLLGQYGQMLQLRNMQQNAPLQNQILQNQAQSGQMENQARQALNQAYAGATTKNADGTIAFDPDKLQQGLASGPAAYKTPEVMKGITDFQKSRIDLQSAAADLQGKSADMIGSGAAAVKAANYDPTLAHSLLDTLPPSPQLNALRAKIDGDPTVFRQMIDSAIQNSPAQQKMQNDRTVASLRANTPENQEMNSWLAAENQGKQPTDPAYKTAADWSQHKIDMQTQGDIARETDPRVVATKEILSAREAAQHQALVEGNPSTAAQLLVNGDATLSELKARGSTPDFIAKTLDAAHQLSGGRYNAQQADSQFAVAKSPANVAFFGSAKSLTDPGGTLDQLKLAAQDLPGGRFPAFNSIADWEKAATGSGPIAKAAALALGVADDYSKVMGGGQGSDTSRLQALKLISLNASPDQRAASIEGIRGAVNSQASSRVGKNPILQRMYGTQPAAQQQGQQNGAPQEGAMKINSHGDKVVFKGGQWQLQ